MFHTYYIELFEKERKKKKNYTVIYKLLRNTKVFCKTLQEGKTEKIGRKEMDITSEKQCPSYPVILIAHNYAWAE